MADIILYSLISIACFFGLASLIYQIITQRKKKLEVDVYKDQMQYAVDQTTREMQKFFDLLQMKPSAKGNFGENIVSLILGNIPSKFVKSQYRPSDFPNARIDFVVQLPQSDMYIPIDSKFILPQYLQEKSDFSTDKLAIKRLNKEVLTRAKELTKYTKSSETTDFVLMFIPDFIYAYIDSDTFQDLATMRIIPTNTSGLLSTIFMIKMQYRFINLNSSVKRFSEVQVNVNQGLREAIEKLQTSTTQLQHCMNNVSDSIKEISELNSILETLGE